jgi:hypothetical protein
MEKTELRHHHRPRENRAEKEREENYLPLKRALDKCVNNPDGNHERIPGNPS